MTRRLRTASPTTSTLVALATALLLLVTLGMASPATAAGAVAPARTTQLAFEFTLESTDSYLQTMGSHQYGVNILVGNTRIDGSTVAIQRISVTEYVDGSGPISGFLTLTWPDGDRLGMSVTGQSQLSGSRTHVYGTLRVVSGTGRWKGYRGVGVMEGLRRGPIGSPVRYEAALRLSK